MAQCHRCRNHISKSSLRKKSIISSEFDRWAKNYRGDLQSALGKMATNRLEDYAAVKTCLVSQEVFRHLGKSPDEIDMCEGGCGIGILTSALGEKFKKLAAWDPSKKSCALAKRRNPNVNIKNGQSPYQLFGPSAFDCVLLSCVIHHVRAEKREPLLKEIFRILKNPGLLIIIEHNPLNPWVVSAVSRCRFDKDAELLSPSKLCLPKIKNRELKYSKKYFGFWPNPITSQKLLDPWLGFLPLGAQWMVSAHLLRLKK